MEELIGKFVHKLLEEYSVKYRIREVFSIVPSSIYLVLSIMIILFMFLLVADIIYLKLVLILFFICSFIFGLFLIDLIYEDKHIYKYVEYKKLSEIERMCFNIVKELDLVKLFILHIFDDYLLFKAIDKKLIMKDNLYNYENYIEYCLKRLDSLSKFDLSLLTLISLNSNLVSSENEDKIIRLLFLKDNKDMLHLLYDKSNKGNKSIFYVNKYNTEINKRIEVKNV